jgi:hypothetical protein
MASIGLVAQIGLNFANSFLHGECAIAFFIYAHCKFWSNFTRIRSTPKKMGSNLQGELWNEDCFSNNLVLCEARQKHGSKTPLFQQLHQTGYHCSNTHDYGTVCWD